MIQNCSEFHTIYLNKTIVVLTVKKSNNGQKQDMEEKIFIRKNVITNSSNIKKHTECEKCGKIEKH